MTTTSTMSARWDLHITATASIVHNDDHRATGGTNIALFRREKILDPTGTPVMVPIVSGNSVRGILRRIGEELLNDILQYQQQLTPAAAHLMRNGGVMRKTARTDTAEEERELKSLVPLIGLFGGAANGRMMSGCARIGKAIPETVETAHLLPLPPASDPLPSQFDLFTQESFSHTDDVAGRSAGTEKTPGSGPLQRYDIETLAAGTRLQCQAHLSHATPTEAALFASILDVFCTHGHLGGRSASGHGAITATTTHPPAAISHDWRAELAANRQRALDALVRIT